MKKTILIILLGISMIFTFCACDASSDSSGESADAGSAKTEQKKQKKEKIKYKAYDVGELMDDLESNAAAAQDKYKGKYVKLTGRLGNIDSNCDYIDIYDANDEFAFTGVQCYTKNDKQKKKIKKMKKGDTIIVKGKITDVGEILGYSLDIKSLKVKK